MRPCFRFAAAVAPVLAVATGCGAIKERRQLRNFLADARLLSAQVNRGEMPAALPADPERYGRAAVLMSYLNDRYVRLAKVDQELKRLSAESGTFLEAPNLCNPGLRRQNAAKVTRALELVNEHLRLIDEAKGEACTKALDGMDLPADLRNGLQSAVFQNMGLRDGERLLGERMLDFYRELQGMLTWCDCSSPVLHGGQISFRNDEDIREYQGRILKLQSAEERYARDARLMEERAAQARESEGKH